MSEYIPTHLRPYLTEYLVANNMFAYICDDGVRFLREVPKSMQWKLPVKFYFAGTSPSTAVPITRILSVLDPK